MCSAASVGVVIPVRNSQRTIRQSLQALFKQDYPGSIKIWIVGNPDHQDSTWDILGDIADDERVTCLKIARPEHWHGRDANLKRFYGCSAAAAAGVDFIVLIDSQVFIPPDWLSRAVTLIQKHHVDGIAGISRRHPEDRSLSGVYQDSSLVSEWPRYGPLFLLSRDTFGKAPGLPITAALAFSCQLFEKIKDVWPIDCTHGWEDFLLAWRIVSRGFTLICTDTLYVYRNHKRKLRLVKQLSAGSGAYKFYKDNPDCEYTRRLMNKAALVIVLFAALMSTTLASLLIVGLLALSGLVLILLATMIPLSVASMIKARDWRGVLFPVLDVLHVGIWIIGAMYLALRNGKVDPVVARLLVQYR
jgi:glycosyltransferase involved in cell wall biosynthesis